MSGKTLTAVAGIIKAQAVRQKKAGFDELQLFKPTSGMPPKFPRGTYIAEYDNGASYCYKCDDLIKWADSVLALTRTG